MSAALKPVLVGDINTTSFSKQLDSKGFFKLRNYLILSTICLYSYVYFQVATLGQFETISFLKVERAYTLLGNLFLCTWRTYEILEV